MLRLICITVVFGLSSCVAVKDEVDRLIDTAAGHIYGIDSRVVSLSDDDFKKEIATMETAFVEFYAPWCGHCKKLLPAFDKAAKVVDLNDIPIKFVKVDCDSSGYNTCRENGVETYPTLKLFRNGEEERRYLGPREPKDLVRYALNLVGDHAKTLTTEEDVTAFSVSDSEYMFLGAFEEETEMMKAFLEYAKMYREKHRFAIVRDPELLQKIGQTNAVISYQPLYLRNKWEPDHKVATDKLGMLRYITSLEKGLVGIVNRENHQEFEHNLPLLITTFPVDFAVNVKHTMYIRNRLLKLSSEYGDKMHFCMGDMKMTALYAPNDRWNDTEVLLTIIDKKGWQYTVPKDVTFSYESVKQIVDDTLSGKIHGNPFKSDDPPKQQRRVKKLVANNFYENVFDENKHVLVELYSPYCEHCKALIPTYNELASRAREDDSLLIAKMDGTSNSVPKPFETRGFPSIYLVLKGAEARPIRYEGERTVESLMGFINFYTKNGVKFVDPEEKSSEKSASSSDEEDGQDSAEKTEL